MLLRVPRIAARAWNHPYAYGLPTFTLVLPTYTLDQAIVEIPDDDIAALIASFNPVITNVPTVGNVVTGLSPAGIAAVIAALRAKYRESAGMWTPGVG